MLAVRFGDVVGHGEAGIEDAILLETKRTKRYEVRQRPSTTDGKDVENGGE